MVVHSPDANNLFISESFIQNKIIADVQWGTDTGIPQLKTEPSGFKSLG